MTTPSINLTLPMPPSANRYWRTAVVKGNAMTYLSVEARQFKLNVKAANYHLMPFIANVAVTLRIFRPQRSGDLDNRLKVVLDSLQGIAYKNDSQVVEIHAYRFEDKRNPRVEVEVTALGLC